MDAKNEPLSALALWILRAQQEILAARAQAQPTRPTSASILPVERAIP